MGELENLLNAPQVQEPLPQQVPEEQASRSEAAPCSKGGAPKLQLAEPTQASSLHGGEEECGKDSSAPTLEPCRSPSMKWTEDPVSVEDVIPTPKARKEPAFEFIEGVQPFAVGVKDSERMESLLKAVSLLSKEAFEEDALEMITRKNKWRLTLLALPEKQSLLGFHLDDEHEQPPALIGFLVYKLRPELNCLSVAKIAIVPEHRRQGHGCRMIDWCVRLARKQQNVSYIALSSLPEAVKFYTRIGFRKFDVQLNGGCAPDEDLVEGQVYMEKPIKGGRRKK